MKKQLPFDLLSRLEPLIQANYNTIENIKEENTFYSLVDRDDSSNFYFKIYIDGSKRIGNPDNNKYVFEWKPENESKVANSIHQGTIDDIIASFNLWNDILNKYNTTLSVHDDNFVKAYAEYYFSEYKILDNDANIFPFNPPQQLLFEKYLDYLEPLISETNEIEDNVVITEIRQEIIDLRSQLPTTTKNVAIQKLTQIWGRIYKHSKKLAKTATDKAIEIFVKQMIEQGIKYIPTLIESINNSSN